MRTVDEYIAGFAPVVQDVLAGMRAAIHASVPDGTETISYDMPTIQVGGKSVVGFAGWKKHVSIYPSPAEDSDLEAQIAPYRSGRGTLKFPLDAPIPYDLIGQVAALLAEQRGRS
ncbi:iron chaperone [Nocardia jejuensis]|uniref:iron chaperone n=1 Tax=Nocardia jejuensis TaxID=328049 RepID=UPI003BB61A20